MTDTLSKRGPDDTNTWKSEHVLFGHKRLAVVDVEGGKQPMTYTHQHHDYTVVYNGELYNTEDIRKELFKRGHRFLGHSDTEVLLHAYTEWKEECVTHFNGILHLSFGIVSVNYYLQRETGSVSSHFSIQNVIIPFCLVQKSKHFWLILR